MTETLPRAMPPSSAGLALLAAADPPDSGAPRADRKSVV